MIMYLTTCKQLMLWHIEIYTVHALKYHDLHSQTIDALTYRDLHCSDRMNFSWQIEAKVTITKLLQRFDFTLVPGVEFQCYAEVTLKPKNKTPLYLTRRFKKWLCLPRKRFWWITRNQDDYHIEVFRNHLHL